MTVFVAQDTPLLLLLLLLVPPVVKCFLAHSSDQLNVHVPTDAEATNMDMIKTAFIVVVLD
jgi:hypothetical protein